MMSDKKSNKNNGFLPFYDEYPENMTRKDWLSILPGVLKVTKARSTKVLVLVVDGDAFGVDTDGGLMPFSTLCDDHGSIVFHETKTLAYSWASAPEYWCLPCELKAGR